MIRVKKRKPVESHAKNKVVYGESIGDCPNCGLMLVKEDSNVCPRCSEVITEISTGSE